MRRGRIGEYAQARGSTARFVAGDGSATLWGVPCQVALPCATQNELRLADAKALTENGVQLVAEGANMPCLPEAVEIFQQAGGAVRAR